MASADTGGKCRSATAGGPRTARPYLPVSLQPKRQNWPAGSAPWVAQIADEAVALAAGVAFAPSGDRHGHEGLNSSAVFPFDVIAYIDRPSTVVIPEGVGVGAPHLRLLLATALAIIPARIPLRRRAPGILVGGRGAPSWCERRIIAPCSGRPLPRAWWRRFSRETSRYWVSMTLPLASTRKHSETAFPRRLPLRPNPDRWTCS
jgi:hypothetical protein